MTSSFTCKSNCIDLGKTFCKTNETSGNCCDNVTNCTALPSQLCSSEIKL